MTGGVTEASDYSDLNYILFPRKIMHSIFPKKRFILTGLFLGLCAARAFALDPKLALNQYLMDAWTTENGLPQNSVQAILQTREGYLWLGTQEGLVRFDGVRFTVFNKANTPELKDENIRALCEDEGGNLWIGTDNGHLLRSKNGELTSVHLFQGRVATIIKDQVGSLWIGAGNAGLARFQHGQLTTWSTQQGLLHNSVNSIYEDKAGRLWIGTDAGLSELRAGKFTHYTTQQGLAPGRVFALAEDQDGTLWIGTGIGKSKQGGLTEFRKGQFKVWGTRDGYPGYAVNRLLTDNAGGLWLGTDGGLYRLRDHQLTGLSRDHLPDDQIRALYEDREGSLWIGTLSGGLIRLRNSRFTHYWQSDGLTLDDVTAIRSGQDGSVWVGTSDGLNRIKDGRITQLTRRDGLLDNYINDIFADWMGNVWLATEGGVSRWQNGRLQSWTTRDGLSSDSVSSFSQDQSGTVYIGTGIGLDRYKDGKISPYLKTEEPLYRWSYLLTRQNNELVAGDYYGGLAFVREGKLIFSPRQEGYPDLINHLYEDQDGCLWISTNNSGGLFRLKEGRFTRITVKDGLFQNTPNSILEDQQGNFWFGSNFGIFRVARQELHDFADGKIGAVHSISYDTTDGMKSRECNEGAARMSDGRLWFATVKGVAIIDPANLYPNTVPPPVVIEGVTVDGAQYPGNVAARFAAGSHRFEFHYTGLSLLVPQKVRFKYKLEGYDKEWVDAETRRTAYYTNIPPGNYTFRVMAANNDGVWNEQGAAFTFYQKPYFWQTWWFIGLCVLGLVGSGAGLNRIRTKRSVLREREKTQLKIAELRLEKTQMQAQAIEAENTRKSQELEEARRLQLSMLPKGNVQLERIEITGAMRTATEVGGDYYDFLPLPDGRYCVVIGDATGHGMSAGLIVGMVKMGLTGRLQARPDLKPMMEDLNAALRQSLTHRGVGMCLGAVMIDPATLDAELCSNGMPFPYHFTNGALRAIELKAQPLGFLKRVNVPTATLQLQSGDALIWVSDGFEERMNARNEEWGTEQVAAALTEICQREMSGEAMARELIAACDRVADGRNNDDDMTIVIVKAI